SPPASRAPAAAFAMSDDAPMLSVAPASAPAAAPAPAGTSDADADADARALAEAAAAAEARLARAAEPRRQELLRALNLCPGGTIALVRMREDLLAALRKDRALAAVDLDFAHLFRSWFNRGFLVLREIDWNTPAAILEKIVAYEAVHEIRDWADLRRRLDPPDRRCFAFFHPATGDEPLVFVEVALTDGVPGAIAPVLSGGGAVAPQDADTAVFYSISNCQKGLKGVSFGSFLIKQVVQELSRELPGLKTFVTLSPAPGFAAWLAEEGAQDPGLAALGEALADRGWLSDEASRKALAPRVLAAAARYYHDAKGPGGRPFDPVARFHLGNGAALAELHWPADLSERGLAQAHGLMVNYLYDLEKIDARHEAFSKDGAVAMLGPVRKLVRAADRAA
ncbi:MAG: malonyl-CoA decarboxylase, partial [Pseudomonadota bacterium]|nr:malonyl-CoA decarboxylase [Pseudomonadota bacterium]